MSDNDFKALNEAYEGLTESTDILSITQLAVFDQDSSIPARTLDNVLCVILKKQWDALNILKSIIEK